MESLLVGAVVEVRSGGGCGGWLVLMGETTGGQR